MSLLPGVKVVVLSRRSVIVASAAGRCVRSPWANS